MNSKLRFRILVGVIIAAVHVTIAYLLFFENWTIKETGKGTLSESPIWSNTVEIVFYGLMAPWCYVLRDFSFEIAIINGITIAVLILACAEIVNYGKKRTKA